MKVVVVVPALNEAKSIYHVVRGIPRIIDSIHPVAVVVVDDGSTDATAQLAAKAEADVVCSHKTNMGVGHGFSTGIKLALDLEADIVVTFDADYQFNPMDIPEVLKPVLAGGADAVVGTRFHHKYENSSIPLANRISNDVMALLLSVLLFHRFSDVSSGFRAFHVRTINCLRIEKRWNTHGFLFDLMTSGYRVTEVPVSVKYFMNRKSRVVRSFADYALAVIAGILWRLFPLIGKPMNMTSVHREIRVGLRTRGRIK